MCCRDHLLTLASTVLEIRGWIPRGCWCRLALWFEDLYYVAPSSPLPSSSGKQSPLLPISPCVIEYLSCIWFEGERFLRCGSPPPPHPPEACNSTPCNRSLKMWLSFSASGTWLINYMLPSALSSLNKPLHVISQVYPNSARVVQYNTACSHLRDYEMQSKSWEEAHSSLNTCFDCQPAYSIYLCSIINVNKSVRWWRIHNAPTDTSEDVGNEVKHWNTAIALVVVYIGHVALAILQPLSLIRLLNLA